MTTKTVVSLINIRAMFDKIDDEVDGVARWPLIGSFATPIAKVLDPIRAAVDGGILEEVRTAIDGIDNQVDEFAKNPFFGGIVASVRPLLDKFRAAVDADVAAAPG